MTWRNKYAFIDFDDYTNAENAIYELHGTQLNGYNNGFSCNIEWNNKKETPSHIKNLINIEERKDSLNNERYTTGMLNTIKDKVDTTNPHYNSCYICYKSGHFAKNCPNKAINKSDYECFKCNK